MLELQLQKKQQHIGMHKFQTLQQQLPYDSTK